METALKQKSTFCITYKVTLLIFAILAFLALTTHLLYNSTYAVGLYKLGCSTSPYNEFLEKYCAEDGKVVYHTHDIATQPFFLAEKPLLEITKSYRAVDQYTSLPSEYADIKNIYYITAYFTTSVGTYEPLSPLHYAVTVLIFIANTAYLVLLAWCTTAVWKNKYWRYILIIPAIRYGLLVYIAIRILVG